MSNDKELLYEQWDKKMTIPVLEVFLFSAIEQKMRYGAELVEMANQKLGGVIKIPTVYAFLKKSTENELLISNDQYMTIDKSENRKTRGVARRYYDITKVGIKHLARLRKRVTNIFPILMEGQL